MRGKKRSLNTVKRAAPPKRISREISEAALSKQLVFSISKLIFEGGWWLVQEANT